MADNAAVERLGKFLKGDKAQTEFWTGHHIATKAPEKVRLISGVSFLAAVVTITPEEAVNLFLGSTERAWLEGEVLVEEPAFVLGALTAKFEQSLTLPSKVA